MKLIAVVIAFLIWLPSAATAQTYLLMAEEHGCHWCARWNTDISAIYPKTVEGQAAPLKRYDLRSEDPDVAFLRPVLFTPTFILVKDGSELGRIEGYPGEDFFWSLLSEMLLKANILTKKTG